MKTSKRRISLFLIFLMFGFSTSIFAKMVDESEVQIIVKKEVERLLNSQEIMGKAIDNYIINRNKAAESTKRKKQQNRAKNIRPVDPKSDHIRGNIDAPITLIEYSDYECPFCKRFHPTVKQLLKNNPDKVRWVYRHFPLGFHDPGATKQAEATECVAELGGNEAFWKYSDFLYERTKSNGNGFPLKNLKPLAVEIGVDGNKFEECLNKGKYTAKVNNDIANGKKIGVTGTPAAFLMNKKGEIRFINGALPLERVQALVNELL